MHHIGNRQGDRINQRKNQFGDCVAIVALSKEDLLAEKGLQPDSFEEEMQEVDAAEVSDVLLGERNFQFFGAEAHRN